MPKGSPVTGAARTTRLDGSNPNATLLTICCEAKSTIWLVFLISYQSKDARKPGRKPGSTIRPTVQSFDFSGCSPGFPPPVTATVADVFPRNGSITEETPVVALGANCP